MYIDENFDNKVKSLPELPGVYKYKDKTGKIIYVGKAKNLRRRVSSYFTKTPESNKTLLLIKNIRDLEFTVVNSEGDALLLENSLIKKLQPKYNILLKDDKTYPWICITNESFPRVFVTRNKNKDNNYYFGPFPSVYIMKTLLKLIKSLYKIRNCKHSLSEESIKNNKFKVCLNYHIHNCYAPCIGNISEEDYSKMIEDVRKIIKGDIKIIKEQLEKKMIAYAKEYKFELANEIKEKISIINKYTEKTVIINNIKQDYEIFAFDKDIETCYISYIQLHNGAIINTYNIELKKKLDESDGDMLLYAVLEIREIFKSKIKNIILPFKVDYSIEGINFEFPTRGEKTDLLKLAAKNAKFYKIERQKQKELKNPETSINRKLETLKQDLQMTVLPTHIECFDNSNIQGTNAVASCVVFINTKPAKKEYRHFNIKTVEGANDFASMNEIVYRRYKRIIEENKELPQLIIIDGGKGQLSSACDALKELNILNSVTIIGIAKRLEEIFFPNDNTPLYLNKNSESLKIIQQARDEAHRFGISFHRNKRSASFIDSELNNIKGIGQKTIQLLLQHYKSVENIKTQNVEELTEIIDRKKAELIFNYFNK